MREAIKNIVYAFAFYMMFALIGAAAVVGWVLRLMYNITRKNK
jgi:hypothetical protein